MRCCGWRETKTGHTAQATEENPADIGSRGEQASRLKENDLWWRGTAWLSGSKEGWPVSDISETPPSVDEERKVNVAVTGVTTNSGISNVIEIRKFSRLGRLLTVTFWVKRFLFIRDLQQRAPSGERVCWVGVNNGRGRANVDKVFPRWAEE